MLLHVERGGAPGAHSAVDRSALRPLLSGDWCRPGQSFCKVNVPLKVGVDPVAPTPAAVREIKKPNASYEAMTSDAFFASVARQRLPNGIDVAFVDGLHTYAQSYRDICNCLELLNPGGVILVHDCLPASADEARVADSYEDAARLSSPGWNHQWTGDGWKAITALRVRHQDVEVAVLDCDHGVGVVHRGTNHSGLSLTPSEIDLTRVRRPRGRSGTADRAAAADLPAASAPHALQEPDGDAKSLIRLKLGRSGPGRGSLSAHDMIGVSLDCR